MKQLLITLCLFLAFSTSAAFSEETASSTIYVNPTTGDTIEVTAMTVESEEDAKLLTELWINGVVVYAADGIHFVTPENLSDETTRFVGADQVTIVQVLDISYKTIGVGVVMQRDTTVHLMVYLGEGIDKVSAITFMIDFVHDGALATPPAQFQ